MKAVVLERKDKIVIADVSEEREPGPGEVRIKIARVGICGSDVHYYKHGRIGDFVVTEPMVLGHEASGVIDAVGPGVSHLRVGDQVCMEPGIPNYTSRESKLGMYNLDPEVRFWATPPIDGCLKEFVVHPADFTFKLPRNVSLDEGAFVEPLAIGVHAAKKARMAPGDGVLVIGAGTIGAVTALAARAAGAGKILVADTKGEKLGLLAAKYGNILEVVNVSVESLADRVAATFPGGANVLFEASGSPQAIQEAPRYLATGGKIVFIGMPASPAPVDIVAAQAKEIEMYTIFRYANIYDRALAILASGTADVKPLISRRFPLERAVEAFDLAASGAGDIVKIMIEL